MYPSSKLVSSEPLKRDTGGVVTGSAKDDIAVRSGEEGEGCCCCNCCCRCEGRKRSSGDFSAGSACSSGPSSEEEVGIFAAVAVSATIARSPAISARRDCSSSTMGAESKVQICCIDGTSCCCCCCSNI
jgi:hypothetical protein